MATVLVTGGAGYIGSHMVKALLEARHKVVTLDDLSAGHRDAVVGGEFVQGDIGDPVLLREVLSGHGVSAVMHFASFIQVGESVTNPAKYYDNNVARTVRLLGAMQRYGVLKFIFSSSAAVYGEPLQVPIPETHPLVPVESLWTLEIDGRADAGGFRPRLLPAVREPALFQRRWRRSRGFARRAS